MNEDFSKYSDDEARRIAYLVNGFLFNTLTEKEHNELDDWVAASDENMLLFEKLTDPKNLQEAVKWAERRKTEDSLQEGGQKVVVNHLRRRIRLWQWVAAACVLITIGVLAYIYSTSNDDKPNNVIANNSTDLLPGSNKATLTLGNGKIVTIDGNADTTIGESIIVQREKGEIIYDGKHAEKEPEYHMLTIPRKGHYKLTLPDGTKAWLNSESSIRYPTEFTGKERKVIVTGEAFFEVAKNKEKPFIVEAGNVKIEALGTQFSVNAYSNEPFLSATLVEGSIVVTSGNHENILKPGQQARINANDFNIATVEPMDVIAWKNGMFKFSNAPIDEIMRQVERWYDAEVVYENKPTDHFNADLPRDVPVSKLLHSLELTKRVHFKIEENKVIVLK
jgi:ferric-dicitrate binding protein FerR (iron transport regulator)